MTMRVLVTGATGYVGGRLVPELLARGHRVRCVVRDPRKLDAAPWRQNVETVRGDVGGDLSEAMADVDVAVFLIHSIGEGTDWIERERIIAENFRLAAEQAGVRRIVYLGGLGDDAADLSAHLRSRHDVLRYLVATIDHPEPLSGILEIGGPDVVSYAGMMAVYATEAGLARRRLIPVPVLTPRLSSLWIGLVTPVPANLARPLVDSLVNTVVVRDHRAEQLFPFERVPLAEAINQAIGHTAVGDIPTKFDDASSPVWQANATDPSWTGGTELTDIRSTVVNADAHHTWQAVCRVGGQRGWHSGELLWKARGLVDRIAGGPGLRRGRRDPEHLKVGEPVDFWRVEDLELDRRLVLRAEMRLPGEAWLGWTVEPTDAGTRVTQTARFRPRGLFGRTYWYAVAPFHRLVFPGLLKGIVHDATAAGRRPILMP